MKINLIKVAIVTLAAFTVFLAICFFLYGWGDRVVGGRNMNTEYGGAQSTVAEGNTTFLLLGRDSAAGLCDVIILASLDATTGNLNVMQIPRDTYFACTDADYKKINGAAGALGSVARFADELGRALGVSIDYYLSLDMSAVKQMVDAVGGIELDVPHDMEYRDPAQDLKISLKAGKQKLDGEAAIGFLRYRAGYVTGDLARMDAQKLFLAAFSKKIASQKNPIVYYNLYRILKKHGETNITERDVISMTKDAATGSCTVSYLTAPGEAVQSKISGAWYYVLSRQSTAEVLESRFALADGEKNFDKEHKFVDKTVDRFYDIYKKRCEYKIYSEKDIENNLININ